MKSFAFFLLSCCLATSFVSCGSGVSSAFVSPPRLVDNAVHKEQIVAIERTLRTRYTFDSSTDLRGAIKKIAFEKGVEVLYDDIFWLEWGQQISKNIQARKGEELFKGVRTPLR